MTHPKPCPPAARRPWLNRRRQSRCGAALRQKHFRCRPDLRRRRFWASRGRSKHPRRPIRPRPYRLQRLSRKRLSQAQPKEAAPKPSDGPGKTQAAGAQPECTGRCRFAPDRRLVAAEFPFAVATPAAVFSRADVLWLVFDSAVKIDISALAKDDEPVIRSASVLSMAPTAKPSCACKLERPQITSLDADGRHGL